MKNNDAIYNVEYDENEIVESLERDEWKSEPEIKKERKRIEAIAKNANRKNERINIRMNTIVLERLKYLAATEGIPYQTLISRVLQKFITGQFVEK